MRLWFLRPTLRKHLPTFYLLLGSQNVSFVLNWKFILISGEALFWSLKQNLIPAALVSPFYFLLQGIENALIRETGRQTLVGMDTFVFLMPRFKPWLRLVNFKWNFFGTMYPLKYPKLPLLKTYGSALAEIIAAINVQESRA